MAESTEEIKAIAEAKKAAGNAAFAAKDYPEAIRLYSEGIQLDATNHVYYSNRSACHASLGDHEKAAADARECVRLNPGFIKGYYRLATAQLELGEIDNALETIANGLKKEPTNSDLNRQLRVAKAKKAASVSAARKGGLPAGVPKATFDEIQDVQDQIQLTTRELAEVSTNLQTCIRDQRRATLTRKEVDSLAPDTRLYKSVGRLFMLNNRSEIEKSLDAKAAEMEKAQVSLKGKQSYHENRLTNQKSNLNELLRQADLQPRTM